MTDTHETETPAESTKIRKPNFFGAFKLDEVVLQGGRMLGELWRQPLKTKLWKGAAVLGIVLVVNAVVALMVPGLIANAIVFGAVYAAVGNERRIDRIREFNERVARAARVGDSVLPDVDTEGPAPVLDGHEAPEVPTPEAADTPDADAPEVPVAEADTPDAAPADPVTPAEAEVPDAAAEADVVEADPHETVEPAAADTPEPAAPADDAPTADAPKLHRYKGALYDDAGVKAARSEVGKKWFWTRQQGEATSYRDLLADIADASTPREARALANTGLLIHPNDSRRCRENNAYRSALEQIASNAKDATSLAKFKTFASEVLGIYGVEGSVATTGAAPTPEANAGVAQRALEVGAVVRLAPVAKVVAIEARKVRAAAAAAEPGVAL